MIRFLVINHAHSHVCGIHGLGRRIYNGLHRSTVIEAAYADCAGVEDFAAAVATHRPDAVLVNYRSDLMGWVPSALPHAGGAVTFATIHNYDVGTVDAYAAEPFAHGFNYVIILDPTLTPADPRILAIGRAIPTTDHQRGDRHDPPWIGSFGFAFWHKGFPTIAQEINRSLDSAVYRLHMPEAFFNGANGGPVFAGPIVEACQAEITKFGITIEWTADHISDRDLVNRVAENDINCLFYVPGQVDPGLSSALDYLIAARRPVLVTDSTMFRYGKLSPDATVSTWPETSLADVLDNYGEHQRAAERLYLASVDRYLNDMDRIAIELVAQRPND